LRNTGCQGDMLPHDLLAKSTVYDDFAAWRDDGTWQKILDALHNCSSDVASTRSAILSSLWVRSRATSRRRCRGGPRIGDERQRPPSRHRLNADPATCFGPTHEWR